MKIPLDSFRLLVLSLSLGALFFNAVVRADDVTDDNSRAIEAEQARRNMQEAQDKHEEAAASLLIGPPIPDP